MEEALKMMQYQNKNRLDVSVLIPVSESRRDNLVEIYNVHKKILEEIGKTFEFIFVFDGSFPNEERVLKESITPGNKSLKVISLNKYQGESKALLVAFSESTGNYILTIPAYYQVKPDEIKKLFQNFTDETDVLVGQRFPRRDNVINRIQSSFFHWLINTFSGESFHDISCGVRLMNRNVLSRINLYGDLHRFIPLLAINKGFVAKEIALEQAQNDTHLRVYGTGVYIRRLLDILTLFFLLKFTQKPLRFFGLLGFGLTCIGLIISLVTLSQRLFGDHGLAERPLFLVGALFLLVGLQTFFIGLVAEIIIFMHIPSEPGYNIEKVIE